MATTSRTYTPKTSDLGYRIRVGVKAVNANGVSAIKWSAWTLPVRKPWTGK